MLLGCTPDVAADPGSGVDSSAADSGRLVNKALGCQLLCHVAHAAHLPLPKRFVKNLTVGIEALQVTTPHVHCTPVSHTRVDKDCISIWY